MKMREPTGSSIPVKPSGARPEHPFNLQRALERFERGFLHNMLVLTQGDQRQAAELLGLSLPDLQHKLTYYEMDALSGVEQRTRVF